MRHENIQTNEQNDRNCFRFSKKNYHIYLLILFGQHLAASIDLLCHFLMEWRRVRFEIIQIKLRRFKCGILLCHNHLPDKQIVMASKLYIALVGGFVSFSETQKER